VAAMPGSFANPLFIYGGVGLGKTHLLCAIAHEVLRRFPEKTVRYVSCEAMMNEFIEAIREKEYGEFRKIRNIDLLLVDDVQFLTRKERFQEEFFNTFNSLQERNSQIILAADRTPQQIEGLTDRLVSRFKGGQMADIQLPDLETRIVIIKNLAHRFEIQISNHVAEYLAQRVSANVRELRGAFISIMALASMNENRLSEKVIDEGLNRYFPDKEKPRLSAESIKKVVADEFDIRVEDMMADTRAQSIAYPRQIGMFLTREFTDKTLQEIAELYGRKDHGSVMHAWKKIGEILKKDAEEGQKIRGLKEYIEQNFER
jgi:chromosomal replication initiator protein